MVTHCLKTDLVVWLVPKAAVRDLNCNAKPGGFHRGVIWPEKYCGQRIRTHGTMSLPIERPNMVAREVWESENIWLLVDSR